MRSLIIDNYDSFTYNIYHLLAEVNQENPLIITNNELSWQEIKELNIDNIIISPGPGNPENIEDFGVCGEVLLKANIPLLGICLGHQGLGYFYGAKIVRSIEPFHGRISDIYHHQDSLFFDIPSPFKVVRYHSLIIDNFLPSDLEIIATTEDNLIMGIKHKFKPFWGVQFHPESICSQFGKKLLTNFHNITKKNKYINHNFPEKKQFFLNTKKEKCQENKQKKVINSEYELYTKKLDLFLDSSIVFQSIYSQAENSFWLDSSMVADGLSRFSYMGNTQGDNSFLIQYDVDRQEIKVINHDKIKVITGDIFLFLQDILDKYYIDNDSLPCDFNGGLIGYFGYELKGLLGHKNKYNYTLPSAQFIFVDRAIIFDHSCQEMYLIYLGKLDDKSKANHWFNEIEDKLRQISSFITSQFPFNNPESPLTSLNKAQPTLTSLYKGGVGGQIEYQLSREKDIYLDNIQTSLEKIKQGESYEICLTNHLYLPPILDPLNYYLQLRKENPAPYSAFLKLEENFICCSSPERFLLLEKNNILESKPIKGTSKRGVTETEDIALKNNLQFSEKEQAENLMIVDLLRHDFGRVCEIGTINVPKLMSIETYSTVHQMVSTIRGKIKEGITAIDCIKSCFPGGSMTGAPKKRTLEIIDELETEARGIYSGSIGFLALNGTMDLNIVIRTAIITPDYTSIGVGGAITILSEAEKEFEETLLKAKALMNINLSSM